MATNKQKDTKVKNSNKVGVKEELKRTAKEKRADTSGNVGDGQESVKDQSGKRKEEVDQSKLYAQLDAFLADEGNQVHTISSGSILEGTIVDKLPGALVVDVGYKSEGIVAGKEILSELVDTSKLNIGDTTLVYVLKVDDDEGVVLSIRRTDQARKWLELEESMNENKVIEAEVVEANSGGVICELGGELRGFIPTSQLDAARVYVKGVRTVGRNISRGVSQRLNSLIGEKIKTRVAELDRSCNKIILSEKMHIQDRDLGTKKKTLSKVSTGDILEGEVSGLASFGIFVNAAGLEGLVHLSELSWDKVENIAKMFSIGDKVKVMVLEIADGGRRVAYSIKRLQKDPWGQAIARYKIGDVVSAKIQKVVDYGAFASIGDGLNGLIHISEISHDLVHNPKDYVKEGETVKVKILSISTTERHLGLSLKAVKNNESMTQDSKSKIIITGSSADDEEVDKRQLDVAIEEEISEKKDPKDTAKDKDVDGGVSDANKDNKTRGRKKATEKDNKTLGRKKATEKDNKTLGRKKATKKEKKKMGGKLIKKKGKSKSTKKSKTKKKSKAKK